MRVRIPLTTLAIDSDGYHLKIEVIINGNPCWLVVDTGASKTVLDLHIIEKWNQTHLLTQTPTISSGLGTNTMESSLFEIQEFSLQNYRWNGFQVAALDLQHINQAYQMMGFQTVAGVLGGDFLHFSKATIHYGKRYIELSLPRTR